MELSERLKHIADCVPAGKRIVDVGCDHAHLPIYLVQRGLVPGALAADVRKGPLEHAKANISMCGLSDVIETRLSDGLKEIRPGEGETLIIAGMGGILIRRILMDAPETAISMHTWILEPQSDMDLVRRQIYETGFHIDEEIMVQEEGKYYPIIRARKGEASCPCEAELKYGPVLLKKQNPMLLKALQKEEATLGKILTELYKKDTENTRVRAVEKETELRLVKEAMRYYEMQ